MINMLKSIERESKIQIIKRLKKVNFWIKILLKPILNLVRIS